MAYARGYLRAGWLRALAVAGLWLACFADPARAAAPPAPLFRFTVFSAKPIADLAFVPRAGAPTQKLQFYPSARSPRYEYRGAMPLRFVDDTGAVVAEATIPAGLADALLLFTALDGDQKATGSASTLRYQIAVLDDGAARHGPGGLAIINLSGLPLTGTVNKDAVILQPGLNPTLTVGTSATIVLQTKLKNKSYRAYADTLTLNKNQRALLLIFPPFYKGALEVQSRVLIDYPPGVSPPGQAKRPQKQP